MARQMVNEFQEYELTPDEQIISQCFNDLQEMYLRNELAECARKLMNVDILLPEREQTLVRAEWKGKMELLSGLISLSSDTREEVRQRNFDQAKGNSS